MIPLVQAFGYSQREANVNYSTCLQNTFTEKCIKPYKQSLIQLNQMIALGL